MERQQESTREADIKLAASRFAEYLRSQTAATVPDPGAVTDQVSLDAAFSSLDAAIEQLLDLATAYGSDPRLDADPLVLPIAALTGEYLRVGADGVWLEPDEDPDQTLVIRLPDGREIDLTGAARGCLLTGIPNLQGMVRRLFTVDES